MVWSDYRHLSDKLGHPGIEGTGDVHRDSDVEGLPPDIFNFDSFAEPVDYLIHQLTPAAEGDFSGIVPGAFSFPPVMVLLIKIDRDIIDTEGKHGADTRCYKGG